MRSRPQDGGPLWLGEDEPCFTSSSGIPDHTTSASTIGFAGQSWSSSSLASSAFVACMTNSQMPPLLGWPVHSALVPAGMFEVNFFKSSSVHPLGMVMTHWVLLVPVGPSTVTASLWRMIFTPLYKRTRAPTRPPISSPSSCSSSTESMRFSEACWRRVAFCSMDDDGVARQLSLATQTGSPPSAAPAAWACNWQARRIQDTALHIANARRRGWRQLKMKIECVPEQKLYGQPS
mmetsp:Transcript_9600/g.21860  ORF Transcript_9600/g.21860 Transcript_9600/m.21860 type:complete len:234 (+) Transcript_9600:113-814(+)